MGIIFDIVMVLYFVLAVFIGYKRGFLLSVAGILAMILSVTIYKIFDIDYIYFAIIYILLLIVIAILSRVIRRAKLPIITKLDIFLGTLLGVFNGFIGIVIVSLLTLALASMGNGDIVESSFILRFFDSISYVSYM